MEPDEELEEIRGLVGLANGCYAVRYAGMSYTQAGTQETAVVVNLANLRVD